MAVTQSQYNFIKFTATGDVLDFKGLLAGFIISKLNQTSLGIVKISNYLSQFELIPQTIFLSAAQPIVVVNFPEFGISVSGLKMTICSNMTVIAMRR